VPLAVDGLICASLMVTLQSARRQQVPVPALAVWLLAGGIAATLGANAVHEPGDGVTGIVVADWSAVTSC
jgi:hypothetical protein